MRKLFIILSWLAFSVSAAQQTQETYYVAAKTGLSMRETASASAKVVEKIPYGTRITLVPEDGEWKSIATEGMMGYWKKVKYNNKTGYIVDSYLFPWPPPKTATVKDMKQYLAQVSQPYGAKLVNRRGNMYQLTESGWELSKQLYRNGAEHHLFLAYEYGSDTYFLPGFSLQQGFLLLRLIPEFKEVFGEKDEFPVKSRKITKDGREFDIRVIRSPDDPDSTDPFSVEKIVISYEDGAFYEFEMYMINNQLVVFLGGGV